MKKIKRQNTYKIAKNRCTLKVNSLKSKYEYRDLYLVIKARTVATISFFDNEYIIAGKVHTKLFFNEQHMNKMLTYAMRCNEMKKIKINKPIRNLHESFFSGFEVHLPGVNYSIEGINIIINSKHMICVDFYTDKYLLYFHTICKIQIKRKDIKRYLDILGYLK